jgi:plastocyanin
MHRRRFLAAAATTTPLLAGCTGGSGDGGDGSGGGGGGAEATTTATPTPTETTTEGEPADATVEIQLFRFGPQKVRIEPGQTVRWSNLQGTEHVVKSARFTDDATGWEFESEPFGQGESVTYTFEEQGIYTYFCGLHGEEQNCAVVLVGGMSYDAENLPCNEGSIQ